MLKITLLKGIDFVTFSKITWLLRTTEPIGVGEQTVLLECFLKLRFDKNWESKEFEVSQFGRNQSEDNLKAFFSKISIFNILYVKENVLSPKFFHSSSLFCKFPV